MTIKTKYSHFKLLISVSVALAAFGAQAGDVTSTFNSGDTLTATQMNEIKDAVNDNDTRITTNEADIAINQADIAALQALANGLCGETNYGVLFGGRCYYLDGSQGVCQAGFELAPQSILTDIATSFVGKTERTTPHGNCCITHADQATEFQDWGMTGGDCNSSGPWTTGPVLGGSGCTDADNNLPDQLTLCQSTFAAP